MKKLLITLVFLLFTATPCWAQETAEETIDGRNYVQWQLLGIMYAGDNQFDLAIDALNKALQLAPERSGIYNNRGRIYYRSGDYDKALADYDKALELDPQSAEAYLTYTNRGEVYYAKQEYKKALDDYGKALEAKPQEIRALYGKASCLDLLKRKKEARAAYQEFLQAAPADNPNRAKAQQRINALK